MVEKTGEKTVSEDLKMFHNHSSENLFVEKCN